MAGHDSSMEQEATVEHRLRSTSHRRHTPSPALRDISLCITPISTQRAFARSRARQARSRISMSYHRRINGMPSNAPERQNDVARVLTYEQSPEDAPSTSSSAPSPNMNPVFRIEYEDLPPGGHQERPHRGDSPPLDNEASWPPMERTCKIIASRLLYHARNTLCIDERALQCLTCRLLPLVPVTGPCGHTRCLECIQQHVFCPCGISHAPWPLNVNVVVQELIQTIQHTEPNIREWLATSNNIYGGPSTQHPVCVPLQGPLAPIYHPPPPPIDEMEDGAWGPVDPSTYAAPSAGQGALRYRIPITPQARMNYATYLVRERQYFEAIPHLARASSSIEVSRYARRMLIQAIYDLGQVRNVSEIEGESREVMSAQATSTWLTGRDLECVFCYDTIRKPVTTPCGHTFCSTCLERSLDYRNTCALCMQPLDFFCINQVGVTEFVYAALSSIGATKAPLPPDPQVIPILACTVAFPAMPCPLFLFDPRYWYMIRRILESDSRQFGMVAYERDGSYSDFGTILEIRDCVHLQDGCTIVTTMGLSRFRVMARDVLDGWCDVVRINPVVDVPVVHTDAVASIRMLARHIAYKAAVWISCMDPTLRAQIQTAFGPMPPIDPHAAWWKEPDGPAWLWWLVSILPLKLDIKILTLATDSLVKRMRAVLRTLNLALRQPQPRVFESTLEDWWQQRHL